MFANNKHTENQIELMVLQNKVNRMLRWGIIFSLVWLAGFGSLVAFILGLKSKKIIEASSGNIEGMGRVWWCLIVGGIGIIIWFPTVFICIVNSFNFRG